MLSDPVFLHFVGLFLGISAIVFITADLRIILNTNWTVFTSRIFLKQHESMETITAITGLITLSTVAVTIVHVLAILGLYPYLQSAVHMVATGGLAVSMLLAFYLKRELAETADGS